MSIYSLQALKPAAPDKSVSLAIFKHIATFHIQNLQSVDNISPTHKVQLFKWSVYHFPHRKTTFCCTSIPKSFQFSMKSQHITTAEFLEIVLHSIFQKFTVSISKSTQLTVPVTPVLESTRTRNRGRVRAFALLDLHCPFAIAALDIATPEEFTFALFDFGDCASYITAPTTHNITAVCTHGRSITLSVRRTKRTCKESKKPDLKLRLITEN